jgi:peptidoglycan/xylan/chitin deacetylase (PgdA/CDA1 family)
MNAAILKAAHNVPVLMYHHVTPAGGMINATPAHFESQIAWLARNGYTSLSAARFAAHLAGDAAPEKSVLITFDDGYLDNWVYAHPVLQRYGMHALLFVVTGWIGEGAVRPYFGAGVAATPGTPGASTAAVAAVAPGCVPVTPDHDACKQAIAAGRADDVMLRWSEIEAMRASDTFEFHSHTHTHTRWDQVCGKDTDAKRARLAQDLADSRHALETRLGAASTHLCWPQGYFDADYEQVARGAGFRYFYTTDALGQNTEGADPEHIYRFAVHNLPARWLARKLWLTGHPSWGPRYHAWKRFKRRLRGKA